MKKLLLFLLLSIFMFWLSALGSSIEDTLSSIEDLTFNRIYANDELSTRLTRLETEIFGAKQSGNIETRIDKLLKSAYYCDNQITDDYSAIVSTNSGLKTKQGGIKGIISKIKNEFSEGSITGYTPSMTTNYGMNNYNYGPSSIYSPFQDPFNTNRFNIPFNDYRYYPPINTNSNNVYRKTNPFMPSIFGVSNRKYPRKYNTAKTLTPYYNSKKPTNINTKTSAGAKVIILN